MRKIYIAALVAMALIAMAGIVSSSEEKQSCAACTDSSQVMTGGDDISVEIVGGIVGMFKGTSCIQKYCVRYKRGSCATWGYRWVC